MATLTFLGWGLEGMMRKAIVGAVVAAGLVLSSGGAALAGERTGNGKETPAGDKARSACAFSGLEDNDFESPVVPGVTQNWGQIIKVAGPLGGANSVQTPFGEEGCNAHLYPNK
jgi:hypothetical protein